MKVPKEWNHGSLGDVISTVRGGFSVKCDDRQATPDEMAVLKTSAVLNGRFDLNQNKYVPPSEYGSLRTSVKAGTIIFCRKNSEEAIGSSALVSTDAPNVFLSDLLWELYPFPSVDRNWLANNLKSDRLRKLIQIEATGTQATMKNISQDRLLNIPLAIPPLPEQRKIAEILCTWDEAIEKLEALRAAKLRRIRSIRYRLFEAAYGSLPQLRRARDVFEPVSERARPDLPLLAVMQDIGIVRRDALDRRVAMPDGDISNYKVVRPGDFVISLRSFEGGLEYSTITGLVSPAYTVLRPITEVVGNYYRHFFKSRSFVGRLDKLVFGIRDGKQIAFRDFGDMHIPAPPLVEQEAQARVFSCLEADIALDDKRLIALTRQKRGLMQKLLTGEWRVTVEESVA